jgi:hypothetical protein
MANVFARQGAKQFAAPRRYQRELKVDDRRSAVRHA